MKDPIVPCNASRVLSITHTRKEQHQLQKGQPFIANEEVDKMSQQTHRTTNISVNITAETVSWHHAVPMANV
jgi:hypothetical protein